MTFLAIRRDIDNIAGFRQGLFQEALEVFFVFDKQDAHVSGPRGSGRQNRAVRGWGLRRVDLDREADPAGNREAGLGSRVEDHRRNRVEDHRRNRVAAAPGRLAPNSAFGRTRHAAGA